mgnify:CR=1 FL=1
MKVLILLAMMLVSYILCRSSEGGWTVFTLTFYPHRDLRSGSTENVKTIIHLAIPTGAAQIATLETIFASVNTPAAAGA